MGISALTVAAYLMVGVFCGAWFWRVIRSTGHRANLARGRAAEFYDGFLVAVTSRSGTNR